MRRLRNKELVLFRSYLLQATAAKIVFCDLEPLSMLFEVNFARSNGVINLGESIDAIEID